MAVDPTSVPNFDDLPKVEGQPQGYAWGIFDKDGKKDVYGTLNFLTPKIITEAAAEVKEGVSISLNWPLNAIKFPLPGRVQPTHRCKTLRSSGMDMGGFDDELEFNTQFSSQWDSLCHVTQDPTGLAYNGFKPTVELLSCQHTAGNELPTIDHWHARGCIVGRGVLIDFKRYAEEVLGDAEYHPISPSCRITVEQLEAVAKWEGVEFKPGDILIVRTGYTEILESPTPADFAKMASGAIGGVKPDLETVKWIWNKKFSAVAGDAHAFEALPPRKDDGSFTGLQELVLHPYLLTGFGMPIGELWDLKALSEYTKKTGKYSFMLTSAPLNHPGLVASPPNAVAIF